MQKWQRHIVVGTVLGGSSLIRPKKGHNYYLSMGSNDPLWMGYKVQELGDLFQNKSLVQDGKTYRCTSSCLESLTEVYQSLYKDGKRHVTMETLDPLVDISIAVWFLDGGGKTGRGKKNAYLNTTRLGGEGTTIVCDYFDQLDMDCTAHESGGRRRIIFSVHGTERLLKTISHHFPNYMYHRL